jgi:hypothetical protein
MKKLRFTPDGNNNFDTLLCGNMSVNKEWQALQILIILTFMPAIVKNNPVI